MVILAYSKRSSSKIRAARRIVDGILIGIRQYEQRICKECKIEYKDPLADVRIWTGSDISRYSESGEGSHLVLAFDGAGCDYFTYQSEFGMSRKYREILRKELEVVGMHFEDCNNWSLAVYES